MDKPKRLTEMDDRIPDKILKEIFPRKLRSQNAFDLLYSQLKKMILNGELKRGQRLIQEEIAQIFGVSKLTVGKVYSRLEKEKLTMRENPNRTVVRGPKTKNNLP